MPLSSPPWRRYGHRSAIAWHDPQQGSSTYLQGRSLATHGEGAFRQQGMARSVTRQPNPTKREPSLSLHHTMGISAAGGRPPCSNPLPWNRAGATGNGRHRPLTRNWGSSRKQPA